MAHDEYEHQRRQTAAMQDAVNRTFERIEMARRTGTVPPRPCCHALDLVSIEPAPLRIEPGALYRSGAGELLRGDHHGGLQGFDGYIGADEITADSELVRVRVVEA